MISRRSFLFGTTALSSLHCWHPQRAVEKGFQYDSIRWVDERQDPSVTLETKTLVAKVIDNTGLRPHPRSIWMEQGHSHHLGYHGIRALWDKDERRNLVAPFVSWLNLQGLQVGGLELDPVDSRSRFGVGRGWPIVITRMEQGVLLKIPQMPRSGIEYTLYIVPSHSDSFDFQVSFTLHKKTKRMAAFFASWPCYMSTYDEVQLFAPTGKADDPVWESFGEKEPFIVGEPVNYVHSQRSFAPSTPPIFPAVYGRIGSRVLIIMMSRPEVKFFLVNAGGHRSYFPVQNPAWDFSFSLPDYEPGQPFGFQGRLIYKSWEGAAEIVRRYKQWKQELEDTQ